MNDGRDIVAVMIRTKVTNDLEIIRKAISSGESVVPLERRRFEFMAAMGFGEPWGSLSEANRLPIYKPYTEEDKR